MTRIHQQVAQTAVLSRPTGWQSPQRIYLAGGASMIYNGLNFSGKFNLPIEFFNPFRNIQVGPEVDRNTLAGTAHWLANWRAWGSVPPPWVDGIQPPSQARTHQPPIEKRSPYAIAAIFCAGLIFFVQAAATTVLKRRKGISRKTKGSEEYVFIANDLASAQSSLRRNRNPPRKWNVHCKAGIFGSIRQRGAGGVVPSGTGRVHCERSESAGGHDQPGGSVTGGTTGPYITNVKPPCGFSP